MSWTGQLLAAKSRGRVGRKIQRKPRLRNDARKPYLVSEVRTHDGRIVCGETSYDLILKVSARCCNRLPVPFLVRRTALLDRFFQAVVEIFVFPAFRDLCLIIELDLINQKARKTLGLAVNVLILGRERRRGRRSHAWLGLRIADLQPV